MKSALLCRTLPGSLEICLSLARGGEVRLVVSQVACRLASCVCWAWGLSGRSGAPGDSGTKLSEWTSQSLLHQPGWDSVCPSSSSAEPLSATLSPSSDAVLTASLSPGLKCQVQNPEQGFSGGSVIKNLPTMAGDTGGISELGRSRMPAEPHSLCATPDPVLWNSGAATTEAGMDCSPCSATRKATAMSSPAQQLEKARLRQQRPNPAEK